jgi:CheY-like chemotaxis protein
MAPRILIVDRNEAFAMMLEQMLVTDGGYDVQVAHNGSDALALLHGADFDLTILDIDLESEGGRGNMDYQDLIQSVRQVRPMMRLMLIPLMGEELPPEAGKLDIQGTLAKPFFADDLLPGIKDALARRVIPPGPWPLARRASAVPEESVPVGDSIPGVQAVLSDLARETAADTVLLLSTNSDSVGVLAHASTLDAEQVGMLSNLILAAVQAAQATARFLGQPDVPFEHNMFEGGGQRLYAMALPPDLLLVVATPVATPLGTIRHNLRRASRTLGDLALT